MVPNDKILDENQGLTPSGQDAGATERIDAGQLAGKTPEELADWYNNTLEMHRKATQKYQEAAEILKSVDTNQQFLRGELERLQRERDYAIEQLSQLNQRLSSPSQTMPNPDEMTLEEMSKFLLKQQQEIQKTIHSIKDEYDKKINELSHNITVSQREIAYNRFFEKEIAPKFPDVTKEAIDLWLQKNDPDMKIPVTPENVLKIAKQIQDDIDNRINKKAEELLKRKSELAEQSQGIGVGANIGAIPSGKKFYDLPEEEQARILAELYKKSKGV